MFLCAWSPSAYALSLQSPGVPSRSLDGRQVPEIRISKLRFTDEDVVTRELASKVGEPYSEEKLNKDLKGLERLGIFSAIEIRPIEEEDTGVILEVDVKEIYPYLPVPSLDVSDEDGLSIGGGLRAVNLRRRAITFVALARFGGSTQIETFLENPWFAGNHMSYRVDAFYRDRANDLDDFHEKSLDLGLRLGSYWGENGRIGGRLGFLTLASDTDGITLSPDNRDNVPTVGFFLGYDDRDAQAEPHHGWWSEFEVAKNGGFLGGDGDYWSFVIDVRRFQPIARDHTLAFFSLATFLTGEVGEEIPVYLDYHLGGTNTVRGWSIGSERGKNQFINTFEYRYDLLSRRDFAPFGFRMYLGIEIAAFADFGIAWDEPEQFSTRNLLDGYGVGFRLWVPYVNLLRFDVGFGEPGEGMRVHVAIDQKPVMQRRRVR